uniref:Restin homolog n=1 Tax=Culex pipiens TaxID=7175 RepID=A0A8D8G9X7_CULPI
MADLFLITVQLHNAYIVSENHNIAPTFQRASFNLFPFFFLVSLRQDVLREKQNHIEQLMREREIDREEGANQTILYQKNVQQVFLLVGVFFGARRLPRRGPFLESVVRIAIPFPDPPSWSLIALLSPCLR